MNDKSTGEEGEESRRDKPPRHFISHIEQEKRQAHQERTQEEHAGSTDRAVRSTKWATWVVAIVGAVALGLGVLQYLVLSGQLEEMKASGRQTDEAIKATNRLADEAAKSAIQTQKLADAAAISAAQSLRMADVAQQSAIAAHESVVASQKLVSAAIQANTETRQIAKEAGAANEISRKALVGVQRAFLFPLGVDLAKVPNAMATGDITGTKPIAWLARIKWENSGNTPTQNLRIDAYCLFSFDPVTEPYNETKTKKFTQLESTSEGVKGVISPDKKEVLYATETKIVFGPRQTQYGGACVLVPLLVLIHEMGFYHYYVYGDATYNDALGEMNSIHRTEFCYEIKLTGNLETGYFDFPGVAPLTSNAEPCIGHNCADEECQADTTPAVK